MNCSRFRASVCSRTDWRSAWLRLGSVPAMKSASRPISVDVGCRGGDFVRQIGRGGDDLREFAEHVLAERGELRRNFRLDFREALDAGAQKWLGGRVFANSHARNTFAEEQLAFAHPDDLVNHRHGPGLVQFLRTGHVGSRIDLRNHADQPVFAQRFDQRDGRGPPNAQRQQSIGKQDRVTNSKDRKFFNLRRRFVDLLRRIIRGKGDLSRGRSFFSFSSRTFIEFRRVHVSRVAKADSIYGEAAGLTVLWSHFRRPPDSTRAHGACRPVPPDVRARCVRPDLQSARENQGRRGIPMVSRAMASIRSWSY